MLFYNLVDNKVFFERISDISGQLKPINAEQEQAVIHQLNQKGYDQKLISQVLDILKPYRNSYTVSHAPAELVPAIKQELSSLWRKMYSSTRSEDKFKALAEYEWWSIQGNIFGRGGAAIGDAMSLMAQIAFDMPTRRAFANVDFEVLSRSREDYMAWRVKELQAFADRNNMVAVLHKSAGMDFVRSLALTLWGTKHGQLTQLFAGRLNGWDQTDLRGKIRLMSSMSDNQLAGVITDFHRTHPQIDMTTLDQFPGELASAEVRLNGLTHDSDANVREYASGLNRMIGIMATVGQSMRNIRNNAMGVTPTGGIDLTRANMNMQTLNGGRGINFHLDAAMLQKLQNAPGFVPVIVNIQPLADIKTFLGLDTSRQTS
jgi:hypothetical protein